MGIRDRLAEIARDLGSQVALARAAGTTESRVSQWLKGDMKRFSADAALNIEERTGYSARWLVLGKGPKKVGTPVASEPSITPYTVAPQEFPNLDNLFLVVRSYFEADRVGRDAIVAAAKAARKRRGASRVRRTSAAGDG